MRRVVCAAAIVAMMLVPGEAMAGEADVVDVEVSKQGDGRFRFDVTVRHADEGWDHYADRWEVLGLDGACARRARACASACQRAAVHALAERRRDPGQRRKGHDPLA